MGTVLAPRANGASPANIEAIENALVLGDLKALTSEQRVSYYNSLCESLNLNPLTKPFDYLILNGKLTLYAKKDCTEQLRQKHGVSIYKIEKEFTDDLIMVTAYARDKHGKEDQDIGVVQLGALKGEAKANALMKAVTKAKRRVTLSICGLALPDESEIDSIPYSRVAQVAEDGRIIDASPPPYVEHRRNSDPHYNDVKHERLDGELIHAPVIDPATNRPVVKQMRHEEENSADAHFGPISTNEDAVNAVALKKGIGTHKGWMVAKKLDPENRELSLYLLNRAEGGAANWTSRKELTANGWTLCNNALAKLQGSELTAWVQDFYATVKAAENDGTDPFAADDPALNDSYCFNCGSRDGCECTNELKRQGYEGAKAAEAATPVLLEVEPAASGRGHGES